MHPASSGKDELVLVSEISAFLGLSQEQVLGFCEEADITPQQEDGELVLTRDEVEQLRNTILKKTQLASSSSQEDSQTALVKGTDSKPVSSQADTDRKLRRAPSSQGEVGQLVDSVSNAKSIILQGMAQLLDEKLSGVDDLVVELIRSQAENEALREELQRLEASEAEAKNELTKFKPAAFGFYRKQK